MKIVQINGFRGVITAVFMCMCIFAGFVVFPGQVAMFLWNKYLASAYMLPVLNVFQGVLIWGMIAVTYAILAKKDFAVSFKETKNLSDAEFDMLMRNAQKSKFRALNNIMRRSKFDLMDEALRESMMKSKTSNEFDKEQASCEDKSVSNLK